MGRIREALEAVVRCEGVLHRLAVALEDRSETVQPDPQLTARVNQLELAQATVLAEAEAMLTRADSRLKAARGAEERARGMERRANEIQEALESDEGGPDPFEVYGRALQGGDAPGGGANGVPAVRPDVGRPLSGKAAARAYKYGG